MATAATARQYNESARVLISSIPDDTEDLEQYLAQASYANCVGLAYSTIQYKLPAL